MDSDIGKDIERAVFWVGFAWVANMTFKRRLSRIGEAVWWAILGAALGLGGSIALWPQLAPDPAGATAAARAGNEPLLWTIVAALAVLGAMLSLLTWEGAQIRRTRREIRRSVAHQARIDRAAVQQAEWQRRAMS
jgi:hypothetical protein